MILVMRIVREPSNRSFGLQTGIVFVVLSLLILLIFERMWLAILAMATGSVLLTLAWSKPSALRRANRLWMGLGRVMSKVVSPVVLAIFFVAIFIPVGLVMRIAGRDELLLRDRSGESFWLNRSSGRLGPETFQRQF